MAAATATTAAVTEAKMRDMLFKIYDDIRDMKTPEIGREHFVEHYLAYIENRTNKNWTYVCLSADNGRCNHFRECGVLPTLFFEYEKGRIFFLKKNTNFFFILQVLAGKRRLRAHSDWRFVLGLLRRRPLVEKPAARVYPRLLRN